MDTKDQKAEYSSPQSMYSETNISPVPVEPEVLEVTQGGIAVAADEQPVAQKKSPTPWQDSLRRLRRDKRAMASLVVIALFFIIPLVGPLIYQPIGCPYHSILSGTIGPSVYHNPFHQELDRQDEGPSWQYLLGTDDIGRDLLARLMQGMLISMIVALLVEVVDIGLGILVGVLAGFYGGWIDQLLARFTDIMFAFPGLLFAILLTGIFGVWADTNLDNIPVIGANGNARLLFVSVALAFVAWPLMARYVRGQTLQLKEQQFIEAARTAGTSDLRIILRHIIPNLFSIVVVASTLNIVGTIIGEAGIHLLRLCVLSPCSR